MTEWQPIETAPKDGTRVFVESTSGGVGVAFYGPKYSEYGVNYGDAWGYGTGWADQIDPPPTKWQPLPRPSFRGAKMTHTWRLNCRMPERKGQPCRILRKGSMGSILIEFEDGMRYVVGWRSVRKITPLKDEDN